jgi:hypothetical protein
MNLIERDYNGRRLAFSFAVLVFANSVIRGIRVPNTWLATQFLLNYDFGFIRRGLLGAAFSLFHFKYQYHYSFFFLLSFSIFSLEALLIISLLKNIIFTKTLHDGLIAILFCSSMAVVMLAQTVGFGEHIALVVVLISLRVKQFHWRLALTAALFPMCILIHETDFLMIFPVLIFRFWIDLVSDRNIHRVVLVALLCLGMGFLVVFVGAEATTVKTSVLMMRKTQEQADFQLVYGAYVSIVSQVGGNFAKQLSYLVDPSLWRDWSICAMVTLPTLAVMITESVNSLRRQGYKWMTCAAAIAAGIAPLLLNLLGTDYIRWNTFAITASFLVFSIVSLHNPGKARQWNLGEYRGFWILIGLTFLNGTSSIELFDDQVVQDFPYRNNVTRIVRVIEGREVFPLRPVEYPDPPPDIQGQAPP